MSLFEKWTDNLKPSSFFNPKKNVMYQLLKVIFDEQHSKLK